MMESSSISYPPLALTGLTEQTYRVLKDKILRLELPPGSQISVPTTASALGVSRTPVNDALKRLAAEGMVEIVPRQGTFVSRLTARDIAEIFDMRLMIEVFCAESIIQAGKRARFLATVQPFMSAMERTADSSDSAGYDTFIKNDRAFHLTLVELTDNHRLLNTYTQLHVHTHTLRMHHVTEGGSRQAQIEHRAIVAAFEQADLAAARAAVRSHISGVGARILAVLEERGGQL
jgi:GntR family transcriptional regulator, rspAB operon transcriptional repressor